MDFEQISTKVQVFLKSLRSRLVTLGEHSLRLSRIGAKRLRAFTQDLPENVERVSAELRASRSDDNLTALSPSADAEQPQALDQEASDIVANENGGRIKLTGRSSQTSNGSSPGQDLRKRIQLTGRVPQPKGKRIQLTGQVVRDGSIGGKRIGEKCQICQEPIEKGQAYYECPNCHGLSHTECWDYIGRCGNNLPGCYLDK